MNKARPMLLPRSCHPGLCYANLLSSSLDFANKVPSGSYRYLEEVWLRDVIRMKAYFRYIDKASATVQTDDEARDDYFRACNYYRYLLIYGQKSLAVEFVPANIYLRERFFDDAGERLDDNKVSALIDNKATQDHIAKEAVTEFVYKFYGNLIPAITTGDKRARDAVQEAIVLSEGPNSRSSIMNCFEAAIAIYFLTGLDEMPSDWYSARIP